MADVVFGSRFMGGKPHRILFFWHSLGNKFLTFLSNMFTNLNLTDMETCYKLFRSDIIKGIDLKEKRFGFEPESLPRSRASQSQDLRGGHFILWEPHLAEGKEIGWKDGFRAIYCI